MSTLRRDIAWSEEFDEIIEQLANYYRNEMQSMDITPFTAETANISGVVEFLLRRAKEELDEEEDEAEVDLENNFRQAWHEAMTGQTFPIDTLWDGIEDDDE